MKYVYILASIFTTIIFLSNTKVQSIALNGGGIIDLDNLFNYANQFFPERAEYRWNDINPITDVGATLGRVLFYDKKLSVNNTVSCASCHQQENAFGDHRLVSEGFEGKSTLRHAMRLINVDFHADNKKFWDERASRLENMTTLPIQDTIEMGFSGINGYPGIDSLIRRIEQIDYYQTLFFEVFGDTVITEERIAFALAQFIRSIITFDSKFDEGFISEGQEISDFPNFTEQENRGKRLFFNFPFDDPQSFEQIGAGCGFCHKAPSMDIIHLTLNNGVVGVANDSLGIDVSVTRSPSIKNLTKPDGTPNGPFMHNGSLETLEDVVEHYNEILSNPANTNLSGLLFPNVDGSVTLNLTQEDKDALIAFLKTLSGNDVYTNEKWSDPFDDFGQLQIIESASCITVESNVNISICEGETYELYMLEGSYIDTFTLSNGCDSIRVLNLSVLPIEEKFEEIDICPSEEYLGFNEAGTYVIDIPAESGCDTVFTLVISVLDEDAEPCLPTSISDLAQEPSIIISPNPVESILAISNLQHGAYNIRILDIAGREILFYSIEAIDKKELDASVLVSGKYFMHILNLENGFEHVTSFVKT